jgi:hypothetical protein
MRHALGKPWVVLKFEFASASKTLMAVADSMVADAVKPERLSATAIRRG